MKLAAAITGILAVFVTVPIWLYLLYQILVLVHASELMFFLYWVYLPLNVLVAAVANIVKANA